MREPIWIGKQLALSVHDRQLSEHGGLIGIRDEGLLDSALARPRQHFNYAEPTPNIPELAASLAFGVARNHPFADGNKRTAAVLMELYLELNEYSLFARDEELLEIFLNLASGSLDESQLADWLTTKVADATTDSGVHEKRAKYAK